MTTRTAEQEPVGPTPGRWTVEKYGNVGPLVLRDHAGSLVAQSGHPMPGFEKNAAANARLICAAVNACQEAGYAVEELEAGHVQRDRDRATVHEMRNSYCPSCGRVMVPGGGCYACGVDLAACREALGSLLTEFDTYDAEMTKIGRGHEDYGLQRSDARALLARLDAGARPKTPEPHGHDYGLGAWAE